MSIAAPFGRKSRLRASDLPLLRSMRDAYRRMLAAAEALRTDPEFITDAAMRMAAAQVVYDLRTGFEDIGRELGRLEGLPVTTAYAGHPPSDLGPRRTAGVGRSPTAMAQGRAAFAPGADAPLVAGHPPEPPA